MKAFFFYDRRCLGQITCTSINFIGFWNLQSGTDLNSLEEIRIGNHWGANQKTNYWTTPQGYKNCKYPQLLFFIIFLHLNLKFWVPIVNNSLHFSQSIKGTKSVEMTIIFFLAYFLIDNKINVKRKKEKHHLFVRNLFIIKSWNDLENRKRKWAYI